METPAYECRGTLKDLVYPCYAELKIDGEYNVFAYSMLVNKYGVIKRDLPVITELKDIDAVFIGELYWGTGKRGSLYKLLAHKKHPDLKFAIFDILRYKEEDLRYITYEKRQEILQVLLPEPLKHTHRLIPHKTESREELDSVFKNAVKNGFEGLVVKNKMSFLLSRTTRWVKMKHKETADLRIVEIDPTRERIEVRVNDNKACGVKVINKYKRELQLGDIVEIQHQGLLDNHGLRHPVYIRRRFDKKEADTL